MFEKTCLSQIWTNTMNTFDSDSWVVGLEISYIRISQHAAYGWTILGMNSNRCVTMTTIYAEELTSRCYISIYPITFPLILHLFPWTLHKISLGPAENHHRNHLEIKMNSYGVPSISYGNSIGFTMKLPGNRGLGRRTWDTSRSSSNSRGGAWKGLRVSPGIGKNHGENPSGFQQRFHGFSHIFPMIMGLSCKSCRKNQSIEIWK